MKKQYRRFTDYFNPLKYNWIDSFYQTIILNKTIREANKLEKIIKKSKEGDQDGEY